MICINIHISNYACIMSDSDIISKTMESIRKATLLENSIKISIVEAKIKEAMSNTCLICMEPLDVYVITPCKHPVCQSCYFKSLKSVNGNKCCLCRQAIVIHSV